MDYFYLKYQLFHNYFLLHIFLSLFLHYFQYFLRKTLQQNYLFSKNLVFSLPFPILLYVLTLWDLIILLHHFFQKFLQNTGILEDLEKAGIQEGDTVRMYGLEFDYYR